MDSTGPVSPSWEEHTTPWPRLKAALREATAAVVMAGPALAAQAQLPSTAPVVAPAATKNSDPTCFDGQIEGPQAQRITEAVVGIAVLNKDGLVRYGSGFIVANSATPGHPENKIVTVAHVLDPLPAGSEIQVIGSDGTAFGTAEIIAKGKRYKDGAVLDDSGAIAITNFADDDARKNFMGRQGLDIGAQSKAEYRTGFFAQPAIIAPSLFDIQAEVRETKIGFTGGVSGGPVINAAGKVVGLAESRLYRGDVAVEAPAFGFPEIDERTHKPAVSEFQMDKANQGYVTAITPDVLRALGPAGLHVRHDAQAGLIPVRALGAPSAACLVVAGEIRKIDFKTLNDFETEVDVPPEARFAHWQDQKLAMPYLVKLLEGAKAALPDDKDAAFWSGDLKKYKDINKVATHSLAHGISDMAGKLEGTPLGNELTDAAAHIESVALRTEFQEAKPEPLVKKITSALKHKF